MKLTVLGSGIFCLMREAHAIGECLEISLEGSTVDAPGRRRAVGEATVGGGLELRALALELHQLVLQDAEVLVERLLHGLALALHRRQRQPQVPDLLLVPATHHTPQLHLRYTSVHNNHLTCGKSLLVLITYHHSRIQNNFGRRVVTLYGY